MSKNLRVNERVKRDRERERERERESVKGRERESKEERARESKSGLRVKEMGERLWFSLCLPNCGSCHEYTHHPPLPPPPPPPPL